MEGCSVPLYSWSKCWTYSRWAVVLFSWKWHIKAIVIWYSVNSKGAHRTGRSQVVHTHRKSCQSGWPRGFGELIPSPYLWMFTCILVDSNPPFLFNSTKVRFAITCSQCKKRKKRGTQKIMWRSTFETGAAQLRSITHRSHVQTETLSGMDFALAQELPSIVWRLCHKIYWVQGIVPLQETVMHFVQFKFLQEGRETTQWDLETNGYINKLLNDIISLFSLPHCVVVHF